MCYSVRCELFYHHFTNLNTAEEKKNSSLSVTATWMMADIVHPHLHYTADVFVKLCLTRSDLNI